MAVPNIRRPVKLETLRKAEGKSWLGEGSADGTVNCPECGHAGMQVKRTTFKSKDTGNLIGVYYWHCIADLERVAKEGPNASPNPDHGFAFRSKHCQRHGEEKPEEGKPEGEPVIDNPKHETKGADLSLTQEAFSEFLRTVARQEIEGMVKDGRIQVVHKHQVKVLDTKIETPPDSHRDMAELLKRVEAYRASGQPCNILLAGPAGTGKTTMVQGLAKALGLELVTTQLHARTDPDEVFPSRDKIRGGKVIESALSTFCDKPSIINWDEFDNGSANLYVRANTFWANGFLTMPDGTARKRHPSCVFIACANTYGTGPTRAYAGRTQLDAATLDRFHVMTVNYDTDLEKRLFPSLDHDFVAKVRANISDTGMRRMFGTRTLGRLNVEMMVGAKDTVKAFKVLTGPTMEAWTDEEISQALNGTK